MKTIGILTLEETPSASSEEWAYFRRLSEAGRELGVRVAVFAAHTLNSPDTLAVARLYDPTARRWLSFRMPLPTVLYDRCRFERSSRFRAYRRFRRDYSDLIYLNRPLANKWAIHRLLSADADMARRLPPARLYRDARDVLTFLRADNAVYLKPINGTGGRGILRVKQLAADVCRIEGRDRRRRILTPIQCAVAELGFRISRLKAGGRYLAQQAIRTELTDGRVHDFRMLVQKNGDGRWSVTGCAARIGAPGSVTANLHGGGTARPAETVLRERFHHSSRVSSIMDEMENTSMIAASLLERRYGRLCELGLDLAVDPSGRVWLLEVNPKPGRDIFRRIGDLHAYRTAVRRPLEYALRLAGNGAAGDG